MNAAPSVDQSNGSGAPAQTPAAGAAAPLAAHLSLPAAPTARSTFTRAAAGRAARVFGKNPPPKAVQGHFDDVRVLWDTKWTPAELAAGIRELAAGSHEDHKAKWNLIRQYFLAACIAVKINEDVAAHTGPGNALSNVLDALQATTLNDPEYQAAFPTPDPDPKRFFVEVNNLGDKVLRFVEAFGDGFVVPLGLAVDHRTLLRWPKWVVEAQIAVMQKAANNQYYAELGTVGKGLFDAYNQALNEAANGSG